MACVVVSGLYVKDTRDRANAAFAFLAEPVATAPNGQAVSRADILKVFVDEKVKNK